MQNLLTVIATAFITGNVMNYYANEGSFHVSARLYCSPRKGPKFLKMKA